MRHRHALNDAQWALICDLLPGRPELGGRPDADNRLFVDAALFVAKTGIPWWDLPARCSHWNSVWRRFDRWCAAGRWEALSSALGEPDLEELQLDSTAAKAHPCMSDQYLSQLLLPIQHCAPRPGSLFSGRLRTGASDPRGHVRSPRAPDAVAAGRWWSA